MLSILHPIGQAPKEKEILSTPKPSLQQEQAKEKNLL
jgi:hypothetical protein